MTIYYLNSKKQEKTLTNVKHIQCSDNHVLYATTEDGAEHTLVVENVTGIIDKDENELNEAQRELDDFKGNFTPNTATVARYRWRISQRVN